MKLISCHHVKKRPPKSGSNWGKLIKRLDDNHLKGCQINERRKRKRRRRRRRRTGVGPNDDALINANSIKIKPLVSLECCHLVRYPRSVYNLERLLKRSVFLSLMCLIIISDFQQQVHYQQRQHLNQQIAKKCAQKDIEILQNNKELASISNNKQRQQCTHIPSSTNKSAYLQEELRSTTATNNSNYQDRIGNEYNFACLSNNNNDNKLWWPLSFVDSFWPKNGLVLFARANVDANRLYEDLMMTYNRIVLPVQNNTDRVVVKLALKLSQLIDVNLKNQMMTTNVWLNQEWSDYKLKWDPSEYGGIEDINVPAEQIWLPDIVLYNSAEGYFAVSIMTKAKVRFDGHVTWNPPAIFRSSCQIDITYFPFDSQNCHLKFGSWTYGTKIDLRHINDTDALVERGTDLSEYYQNVEWDIMRATAKRNFMTYTCCPNDFYPDVTFKFELRRKPLFYTVNLIAPCIAITILSFAVFYLPSDSGEKVTLTISILVSLIFFLSVLIETIPSTSLAMPLLGKYLVFTMILITVSVCATVCVLNIHFRTPSTHSMPAWFKRWCIEILPRYLFMNVPQYQSNQQAILPEQLIYLHNQAYTAQQQQQQQHNQNQSQSQSQNKQLEQRQQQHQTTDINWPSAKIAAEYIKANHSSEFGQNSFAPAASSSSSNNNNNNQSNTTLPGTEFRQLDVGKLKKLDPKQPTKAAASVAVASLNISPSSLLLPYLQSEAARRLQMQRSRSSDRDRSTSDHRVGPTNINTNSNNNNNNNNLLPNTTATTNNNSCDNNQFSPPSQKQPLSAAQSNQRNNTDTETNTNNSCTTIDMQRTSSHKNDGSSKNNSRRQKSSKGSSDFNSSRSKSEILNNKSKQSEKLAKSDKRNFIKRIFAPRHTSVIKEEGDGSNSTSSDIEASRATILERVTDRRRGSGKGKGNLGLGTAGGQQTASKSTSHQLQHDTSSSFENDYQYHNHFQARASICSTNIWRVGPSRRCSVAVPTNYPTFYQPALAQIAHPSVSTSQQQHQTGNQPLSTLSGCVANHNHHHLTSLPPHHHHHNNLTPNSDSSESSTQSGAIDALVKATTTKLTLPQSRLVDINRPSTSDSNHATTNNIVSGDQEMKQLNSNFIGRINLANNIPNYNFPLQKQQHQHQLKQLSSNLGYHLQIGQSKQPESTHFTTPTPPPPPPLPALSPIPNNSLQCQGRQQHQHQHQLILNPANLQRQNQYCTGHVPSHQQQEGLLVLDHESTFNPARQSNQPLLDHSNPNQHVNLNGQGGNYVNNGQRVGFQSLSGQFGQAGRQPIVYRVIPRSRSTDYRLCQHAAGRGNVATSGDESYYYATRDINDHLHLPRHNQPNMLANRSLLNDNQTMRGGLNVLQQQKSNQQQLTGGDKYLVQGSHTIGRAIGQAYMQRLERQPTIYSLHSNISANNSQNRPSRSFQRAYLKPLGYQQEMSQFSCQNNTQIDNMRRSKSQTSLNRRAQFDCDQCNFAITATSVEQPWLTNNINNEKMMRGHHHAFSHDLNGQQSSGQHSCGRSLKHQGCCSSSIEHNNHQHCHHHQQLRGPQMSCCSSELFRCSQNSYGDNKQASLEHCNPSLDQRRQVLSDYPPDSNIQRLKPLNTLGLMRLIGDVDKAIQNAMFIAQHIDNLDEFESVKENWKYIAMVIDRIFLIVFLFACIVGTVTIFAMVPWSYYTTQKPIDLRLTRLMALNITNASGILMDDDPYSRSCRDF